MQYPHFRVHDSCFDFMHMAIANGRRYLDLKALGSSPNKENDLNQRSSSHLLASIDATWRDTHAFASINISINIETFATQKS
jgi:hypothetical protein